MLIRTVLLAPWSTHILYPPAYISHLRGQQHCSSLLHCCWAVCSWMCVDSSVEFNITLATLELNLHFSIHSSFLVNEFGMNISFGCKEDWTWSVQESNFVIVTLKVGMDKCQPSHLFCTKICFKKKKKKNFSSPPRLCLDVVSEKINHMYRLAFSFKLVQFQWWLLGYVDGQTTTEGLNVFWRSPGGLYPFMTAFSFYQCKPGSR